MSKRAADVLVEMHRGDWLKAATASSPTRSTASLDVATHDGAGGKSEKADSFIRLIWAAVRHHVLGG
jgi:hypothetical protein